MLGRIMDRPLMISSLLQHADTTSGDREIVTRTVEGPIHRYTYRDAHRRARQLANALHALDVKLGDRIATMAWNTHRHFEIYYAVSGIGAVTHTLNPRLHPSQLTYIMNHAEDAYIFVDLNLVPLIENVAGELRSLKGVIVMTDRAHMPETSLPNILCYEDSIDGHSDGFEWPEFDENTASSSATRRARRAIPRARSSATARPSCTPMHRRFPMSSIWVSARSSCRSCRCST